MSTDTIREEKMLIFEQKMLESRRTEQTEQTQRSRVVDASQGSTLTERDEHELLDQFQFRCSGTWNRCIDEFATLGIVLPLVLREYEHEKVPFPIMKDRTSESYFLSDVLMNASSCTLIFLMDVLKDFQ